MSIFIFISKYTFTVVFFLDKADMFLNTNNY